MTSYKKAALSLRELAARDREWLLKRLPNTHQVELRKMLAELDEIGIPKGQRWLSELESEEAKNNEDDESTPNLDANLVDSLTTAEAKQIKRVLAKEPDAVVAIILAGGEWPWSKDLLSSYKGLRRQRLETLRQQREQDLPDKVLESVLRALDRRLSWELTAARGGLNGTRRDSLIGKTRTLVWRK